MTVITRTPPCVKCGAETYTEWTREICCSCGYVQGEGAYLAPELLPVEGRLAPESSLEDILECGTARETFEALVAHLEGRQRISRDIANRLRCEANDAYEQADRHDAAANDFAHLIYAMKNAPITSPPHPLAEMTRLDEELGLYDTDERVPPASCDTLPKGQDAKQGLAGTESGAVPEGQTPTPYTLNQGPTHER